MTIAIWGHWSLFPMNQEVYQTHVPVSGNGSPQLSRLVERYPPTVSLPSVPVCHVSWTYLWLSKPRTLIHRVKLRNVF